MEIDLQMDAGEFRSEGWGRRVAARFPSVSVDHSSGILFAHPDVIFYFAFRHSPVGEAETTACASVALSGRSCFLEGRRHAGVRS